MKFYFAIALLLLQIANQSYSMIKVKSPPSSSYSSDNRRLITAPEAVVVHSPSPTKNHHTTTCFLLDEECIENEANSLIQNEKEDLARSVGESGSNAREAEELDESLAPQETLRKTRSMMTFDLPLELIDLDTSVNEDMSNRTRTPERKLSLTRSKKRNSPEIEELHSPKSVGLQLIDVCKNAVRVCRSGPLKDSLSLTIIKDLLMNKPDLTVSDFHGSALMWLAYHGFDEAITILLEQGACLDIVSKRGDTALHAAADAGHLSTVKLLLAADQSKRILNQQAIISGYTALHFAVQNGHDVIVSTLLEAGAELHHKDRQGRTALHLACWKNRFVAVVLLLDRGADVEARAHGGFTPLFAAVYGGTSSLVDLLLEKGADYDARTDNKKTVDDWASPTNKAILDSLSAKRGTLHLKETCTLALPDTIEL